MPQKSLQLSVNGRSVSATDRAYVTLADSVAALFEQRGDGVLRSVVDHQGFRGALLEVYRALYRLGLLTAIEELPAAEKQSLWAEAKELGVPALGPEATEKEVEAVKDTCRALHGLATAVLLRRAGQLKPYLLNYENTAPHPKR